MSGVNAMIQSVGIATTTATGTSHRRFVTPA